MIRKEVNERSEISLKEAKKRAKKKKNHGRLIGAFTVLLLVLCAAFMLYNHLFVVRFFRMEGTREYTQAEALDAAAVLGIREGIPLFSVNRAKAEMFATYALSRFDEVKIGYELPDTVVFRVKDAKPALFVVYGGDYYVLSEALRVLEKHTDMAAVEALSVARVDLGTHIGKCVTGDMLVCDDGYDDLLRSLTGALTSAELMPEVSFIDLANRFDIRFLLRKRFTVILGTEKETERKLRFLRSILPELTDTESGYIDISDDDLHEGFIKPY